MVDFKTIFSQYKAIMNVTYRVILEPDGKGFHGYVPALSGCHTWGKTIAGAKKHLKEAIAVYVESLLAKGEKIPVDASFDSFESVDISRRGRRTSSRRQYA